MKKPKTTRNAATEVLLWLLPLVAERADDERDFVKNGVGWARRVIARCSPALKTAAKRVGKDALRELTKRSAGTGLR